MVPQPAPKESAEEAKAHYLGFLKTRLAVLERWQGTIDLETWTEINTIKAEIQRLTIQ